MKNRSIICSLFMITLFFLLNVNAKPSVSIDSLAGTVEIQRAGTIIWTFAAKNIKLFNNDLIRVADSGIAVLAWPDGTSSYVNKKSQILVTLFQKKGSPDIVSNITVMFGATFFIVKKILPSSKSDEMKIYTPTAVLSIRGTSFLVDVDNLKTKTTVKMINGLLMVKNISKNISVFLGTPFQTEIELDRNPSTPEAVLKSDIDSIKMWVPEPVIDKEIASQIENSKNDRLDLESNYQSRCLITQFTNKSGYKGSWNIGQEITRYLGAVLRKNLTQTVIMITDSIAADPAETAKSQNARFYISGRIDKFELIKRSSVSIDNDSYRESVIARTSISIKLFDMTENQELLNESFTTDIPGKSSAYNSWNSFHKKAFDLDDSAFTKTIIGSAIYLTINKSINPILDNIKK